MASKYGLFPYSGNKSGLIPDIVRCMPKRLGSIKRVVEPFAGSLAFSGFMQTVKRMDILAYETNTSLCEVYKYLLTVEESRLRYLETEVNKNVGKDLRSFANTYECSEGELTFLRLNAAGVYRGALQSWKITRTNGMPVSLKILSVLKNRELFSGLCMRNESAESYLEETRKGDLVFLDPPYFGTYAGYEDTSRYGTQVKDIASLKAANALVSKLTVPVIFTYGEGAQQIWPNLNWQVLKTKKVHAIRSGEVLLRTEHVAFLNC